MVENTQRRLAAIVSADVVGYSRLMGVDETATLAAFRAHRNELIDPKIAEHGGRIVKTMGDGLLLEFPSVVNATQCVIEIQQGMAERNKDIDEDRRIAFRVGVNLGDIIIDGEDIHGDGVNIAARLQEIAEPGGVAISRRVHEDVRDRLDAPFDGAGEQTLKNIARPIHVWRWSPTTQQTTSISDLDSVPAPLPARPAIAVLPFVNMSGDPEQEYFSDGLAEDIITALSHWHSFPVIARNSSFSFKGQQVRVDKIAEELKARYILEGSVRKSGERLRITAQLIDSQSGHHVWAERFDRQMEEIFDIQDEITNRIAATIVPELEHFEHRRSTVKRTEDLNAWDYYLKGMETFHDENCEGTTASIRMFKASVDLDLDYCDAWARLGWCHARLVMFDCVEDRKTSLKYGFEAARKALALDDGSALAHISLGTVYIWNEEIGLGLAEAQIALQLNPNFAIVAMAVGNRLDLMGKSEEGISQMERSLTLNPRDPNRWRYMAYLSRACNSVGDHQRAADWARQSVLLRPDHPEALFRCAVCVAHLDEVDEARDLLDRCKVIDPNYLTKKAGWRPYASQVRNDQLLSGMSRHNLL